MQFLHVNINRIRSNRKRIVEEGVSSLQALEPVCTAKPNRWDTGQYGHRIAILDKEGDPVAYLVYSPFQPLPCGAVVYIESQYGTEVLA